MARSKKSAGAISKAGITDEVEVVLNAEPTFTVNADGEFVYPEGVKGPAVEDTFEVHPNLRESEET